MMDLPPVSDDEIRRHVERDKAYTMVFLTRGPRRDPDEAAQNGSSRSTSGICSRCATPASCW
jgi:hypothetical protein